MPLIDSDGALLRACQGGDRAAREALIHRYKRLIYSIPVRCGLSAEDAADVLQTVYVKLFEKLQDLHDERHLVGWLITTATREARRMQKKNGRCVGLPEADPDAPEDSSQDELLATDPSPDEVILQLEEERMVEQAMEELGGRCRKLIEMLYFTDPAPSYLEIAQCLQMSPGSVGPTRARCLEQLRKILQSKGFES